MTFFPEIINQLQSGEDGWTLDSADKMWMIAAVDTWSSDESIGSELFLGMFKGAYCWYYEFDDQVFVFTSLPDAKAELALADPKTTVFLFLLNLGDYLRFARASDVEVQTKEWWSTLQFDPSREYFRYKMDRSSWRTDKRAKRSR